MNLKKTAIVIGHEYSVRVRKKSFILTTILTPLLLGLCFAVPMLIMYLGGDETQVVKVVDQSGFVLPYLENDESVVFTPAQEGETVEYLRDAFSLQGCYAVVGISAEKENGEVDVVSYSKEPLNVEVKATVSSAVSKAVRDRKLASYNIENLDSILNDVKSDIRVNAMTLSGNGEAKEDSVEVYMILAYLLAFFIYIFVFMFGTMVMRSVIDEKSSRVVEVIVSSVKSIELMMGKIIGVALVALTQFAIWVGLTLATVFCVTSVLSGKMVEKMGGEEVLASQISQMKGSQFPVGQGTPDIATIIEAADKSGEDAGVVKILRQLGDIHWGYIAVCFLIYFVFGYLLYAAMFAAIGAAVDSEADTQQLQLPVTVPLVIGLFIMLHTFEHPSSTLSFWASVIPFTSPMVMLARIPFGVVPFWELALSVMLLVVTFLLITYISAKIYKVGILTYGKKSTFKDLIRWIKQKN